MLNTLCFWKGIDEMAIADTEIIGIVRLNIRGWCRSRARLFMSVSKSTNQQVVSHSLAVHVHAA